MEKVATVFVQLEKPHRQTNLAALAIALGLMPTDGPLDRAIEMAIANALDDLDAIGVLQLLNHMQILENENTRRMRGGALLQSVWPEFFRTYLEEDQERFLDALVDLSEVATAEYSDVTYWTASDIFAQLGWSTSERADISRAHEIVAVLHEGRFLKDRSTTGSLAAVVVRPTYRGAVRATRAVATEWQERIATMATEWETVTVDFKRQLALRREAEKAEFVKDVCGLATTKASGRERYMVIGFDNDTRTFTTPVDPSISQDRLEQILDAYVVAPQPIVRYIAVPLGDANAGVIEIHRDPSAVPYVVGKDIQKLRRGDVFVRHGTQTVRPDADELAALQAEALRARHSPAKTDPPLGQ